MLRALHDSSCVPVVAVSILQFSEDIKETPHLHFAACTGGTVSFLDRNRAWHHNFQAGCAVFCAELKQHCCYVIFTGSVITLLCNGR